MKIDVMIAKLHGIRVTGADLHYEGSIEIDSLCCDEAGLLPLQFVEIWNKSSGARISTYVIHGAPGSGCCVLNGAAARTCQVGDELIVAARAAVDIEELAQVRSRVLLFDTANRITKTLEHILHQTDTGTWRSVPLKRETRD